MDISQLNTKDESELLITRSKLHIQQNYCLNLVNIILCPALPYFLVTLEKIDAASKTTNACRSRHRAHQSPAKKVKNTTKQTAICVFLCFLAVLKNQVELRIFLILIVTICILYGEFISPIRQSTHRDSLTSTVGLEVHFLGT